MASSSSSRKRKYDVFLSFRGEDTRPNILSHLRRRLDDERIGTFKDDTEMERGEEIRPSLLEAIESSTIALIILSKGYASSKWCLDELVKIMKCRDSSELKVIPIFYDVDPSDVRNPTTGIFADDFARHGKNSKEEEKLWRPAMAQVANLSGHDLKNFRTEPELLDEVIADVWKNLKPTQRGYCRFVGIDSQIEEVKRLLCLDKSDDIRVIGIVGMGGIGKTTIARVTSEQIFREFDGISFVCVEEIPRELGRPNGLIGRVLSDLLKETVIINRSFVGGFCDAILTRLCRKKVLIVLDDVKKYSEQLEDLVGQNSSSVFGRGSRIIATGREKQLLRTICSDGIYQVRGLYDDDALRLFCQHAFKQNYPKEDFSDMVWPILRYADGNPLALKVLGSHLFMKPKSSWESALDVLNKCQNPDIHNVLRISYDGLDENQKKIFLHACLWYCGYFPLGTSRLIALLDSCGLQTRYGLDVLRDKCLLDFEDPEEDWVLHFPSGRWGYVQIHSLLREMGREIVGEESDDPGKRSRLWNSSDIYQVFNENSGTEAIQGIKLDYDSSSEEKDVYLNSDAFEKMPNLKFLILRDAPWVHCPLGLEYLPNDLCVLEWHGCPLKRLPINFQPTNLLELNLKYGELEQLWEGIQKYFQLRS